MAIGDSATADRERVRLLDYITNRVVPDFSVEIRALEGLWSSSSVAGSQKSAEDLAVLPGLRPARRRLTIGDLADTC